MISYNHHPAGTTSPAGFFFFPHSTVTAHKLHSHRPSPPATVFSPDHSGQWFDWLVSLSNHRGEEAYSKDATEERKHIHRLPEEARAYSYNYIFITHALTITPPNFSQKFNLQFKKFEMTIIISIFESLLEGFAFRHIRNDC